MLRKTIIGWSVYTLIYIGIKLLMLVFAEVIHGEWISMFTIVTATVLIMIAGDIILNEFLGKKTRNTLNKPNDVGVYLSEFG